MMKIIFRINARISNTDPTLTLSSRNLIDMWVTHNIIEKLFRSRYYI